MATPEPSPLSLAALRPVVCVVGPTGSGKTALAQEIALRIDAEVTSADSMQIYRGMDIGTGKIRPDEMRVPHHGLDLVDPGEPYSAALFQTYARTTFAQVEAGEKRNVLCGGTGFYVRAAIDAYDFPQGEQEENPERERWNEYARVNGAEALWRELQARDPESAAVVHPNNVKRVVRALELHAQGVRYCDQVAALKTIPQAVPAVFVGLSWERETLYRRINARVDQMVEDGLVCEVEGLLTSGFREGITAPQAIGYKEIVAYLDGECTLDQAIEQIKQSTRRYAKRQISWFGNDPRVHWLSCDGAGFNTLVSECMNLIARID